MFVFMCISLCLYLVNTFAVYAASALAANAVFRSVVRAALPLMGERMSESLGLGWGRTPLAFLAMTPIQMPLEVLRWGNMQRRRLR